MPVPRQDAGLQARSGVQASHAGTVHVLKIEADNEG